MDTVPFEHRTVAEGEISSRGQEGAAESPSRTPHGLSQSEVPPLGPGLSIPPERDLTYRGEAAVGAAEIAPRFRTPWKALRVADSSHTPYDGGCTPKLSLSTRSEQIHRLNDATLRLGRSPEFAILPIYEPNHKGVVVRNSEVLRTSFMIRVAAGAWWSESHRRSRNR